MSTAELEQELARWRSGTGAAASGVPRLTIEEALAFRNAGNLPDEHGRWLRLVLRVEDEDALLTIGERRLRFEPDFHDPPVWRRAGSKPVNIVPLRRADVRGPATRPWWEQPELAELEAEWQATGAVGSLRIPGELRHFVFKTILALRAAGAEVTPERVAGSIARWTPPQDAALIEAALERANRSVR
jgi:hypothetical protein